jgi:hypothetical protein
MPQLERLLNPDHGVSFTKEELSWVRAEPYDGICVFYCTRCRWNTVKQTVGPFVPWEVAHDGARTVIDHYRGAHR